MRRCRRWAIGSDEAACALATAGRIPPDSGPHSAFRALRVPASRREPDLAALDSAFHDGGPDTEAGTVFAGAKAISQEIRVRPSEPDHAGLAACGDRVRRQPVLSAS